MSFLAARRSNIIAHFQTLFVVVSLVVLAKSLPLQRSSRQIAVPGHLDPIDDSIVTCKALREERKDNSGSLEAEFEVVKDFYENNGYLLYDLVKKVYEPTCLAGSHDSHIFTTVQCFSVVWIEQHVFCWCADPNTGKPQNVSAPLVEKHITDPTECEAHRHCEHNDEVVEHGDQVSESCITCVCYNGVLSCNATLCPSNGNMTSLQLYNLRINLLTKMFVDMSISNPDYNVHLDQVPAVVAFNQSVVTLPWKFEQLDSNNRGSHITHQELFFYAVSDVLYFTKSVTLALNFSKVVDLNKDYKIVPEEWRAFFNFQDDETYLSAINSLDISGSGSGFGK